MAAPTHITSGPGLSFHSELYSPSTGRNLTSTMSASLKYEAALETKPSSTASFRHLNDTLAIYMRKFVADYKYAYTPVMQT